VGTTTRRTDYSGNGNVVTDNRAILDDDHISFIRSMKRAEMFGTTNRADLQSDNNRILRILKNAKIRIIY